jgi:hypothetical protein
MATRRLAADYPEQRATEHTRAFEQAIGVLLPARPGGGVRDFRAMSRRTPHARPFNGAGAPPIEARLRGLAPGLGLGPLLAPSSPWGRQSTERSGA